MGSPWGARVTLSVDSTPTLALGIPAAFLYTDDDLLAKLLLRWGSLSKQQKRELVKLIEATPEK
ncbi:hypothetical protein SmaCSM2_10895 [Stenotrophomonas maltophilia]|uniref:Uncharacterized protein n=1 Tax=Stenotrophomonas maltophilia TaxID=40324 RepID=A0AAD0BQI9_STEMA|nr:hypothetical protein SmaCSM2_10895 [Stenotrophomonas maltophilia]